MLCQRWAVEYKSTGPGFFPVYAFSSVRFLQDEYIVFSGAFGLEGIWKLNNTVTGLSIVIKNVIWRYDVLCLTGSELVLQNKKVKKYEPVHLRRDDMIFY